MSVFASGKHFRRNLPRVQRPLDLNLRQSNAQGSKGRDSSLEAMFETERPLPAEEMGANPTNLAVALCGLNVEECQAV